MIETTRGPGSPKLGGPAKPVDTDSLPHGHKESEAYQLLLEQADNATKQLIVELALAGEVSPLAANLLIESLHLEAA